MFLYWIFFIFILLSYNELIITTKMSTLSVAMLRNVIQRCINCEMLVNTRTTVHRFSARTTYIFRLKVKNKALLCKGCSFRSSVKPFQKESNCLRTPSQYCLWEGRPRVVISRNSCMICATSEKIRIVQFNKTK